MQLNFPGVQATATAEAITLYSPTSLQTLSSAVCGGGFGQTHYIVNRYVTKSYASADPVTDLKQFARGEGIAEPFVGLMTAVTLAKAQVASQHNGELTVAAIITAGLSNATVAGITPPATLRPGTINLILLIDAHLTPGAMVNAIITATEAKTHTLLRQQAQTPQGDAATGTSTDAVVIACTNRREPLPYAGPVTPVGWLIGQVVRQGLQAALAT